MDEQNKNKMSNININNINIDNSQNNFINQKEKKVIMIKKRFVKPVEY